MVRLFSAIELPGSIRAELAERLRGLREPDTALRWVPSQRWHITLGFYGDREHVERRGAWFRRQATGLAAARLRLRGAGRFPGVLWVGASPETGRDATALRTLATALNADGDLDGDADELDFVPHVTIARWRRGAARSRGAAEAAHELADFSGSWWTAAEVVLFRSEQKGPAGPVYTVVDRVPLAGEQGRQTTC